MRLLTMLFLLRACVSEPVVCPGTPANHSLPTQVQCAPIHGTANPCCSHSFYGDGGLKVAGYGCQIVDGHNSSSTHCCSPGPKGAPSTTLPNCLIIGDSVSLGYVGHVASMLSATCKVQHGPWCGGGSAGNIAGALPCLGSWLTTAMGEEVSWDVVSFNFGLHDLGDNSTTALDTYQSHMREAARILLTAGSGGRVRASARHVQYALTTPQMQFEVNQSDPIVSELNVRAAAVMADAKISVVDLYSRVKAKCGQTYTKCPGFCDSAGPGGTCTYHYTSAGYEWIAQSVADGISELLKKP